MKRCLLPAVILLALSLSAAAQETGWKKSVSIEVGTGFPPLHATLVPSSDEKYALADMGLSADTNNAVLPMIDVSGRFRVSKHSEFLASAGVLWRIYQVTQYEAFGINPDGSTRYNLDKRSFGGWRNSRPVGALAARYHYIWSTDRKVKWFSGAGASLVISDSGLIAVPELTFIGLRYEWEHLSLSAENSYGPLSTLLHLSIGWTF